MTQARTDTAPTQGHATKNVLSVDAMGGDKGPATVVAGLSMFLTANPGAKAILHGPQVDLAPMVEKTGFADRITIHDATGDL